MTNFISVDDFCKNHYCRALYDLYHNDAFFTDIREGSNDQFDAVLTATEDLKEQFSEMQLRDKKSIDFGLMIKESPDTLETTLLITSRNKMRGTEVFERSMKYSGVYADTSKMMTLSEWCRTGTDAIPRDAEKAAF